MIRRFLLLHLVGAILWPSGVFAQTMPASEGTRILEQAVASAGGRVACQKVSNFRAAGEFFLYTGGESPEVGSAVLAGSGLRKFRLTASLGDEARSWLWNDGVGALVAGNAAPQAIGVHNLSLLEGVTLPVLKIVSFLDGPSWSIRSVEKIIFEGQEAHRVRLIETESAHKGGMPSGIPSAAIDVLIDAKSWMVLAIESGIYPNGNTREEYRYRVTYGDFREIEGAQVPFSIQEQIDERRTWSVHLKSFESGANFSSAEFELLKM